MPRAEAIGRPARAEAAAALLLALLAVALRLPDLGNPVLHVDEEYYLLVGDRWLGGARLYQDLWDRKPAGLFAIYALARLLPGDGVLAYQLLAAAFAAATAWLVFRCARAVGADARAAGGAGAAYLVWLELLSGRGGQSPVFYNLFTTGAALLTLGLPRLAREGARGRIVRRGAAACLLAGLAIQTKYTPVVEGAFFGLAHLWHLRRAGARAPALAGAALLWVLMGALPTLVAVVGFALAGPAAFRAFWFANFVSITLRRGFPAAKIAARLAGIAAQLLPFALCASLAWRERPWGAERRLLWGWLAAALVAFAMIGAFFDHYALPLVAPLAILSTRCWERRRWTLPVLLAAGLATWGFKLWSSPDERGAARAVAAVMAAHRGEGCPYVFAGDSALYLLSRTCTPTRYAFPSTLAYESERGASGADEVAEVSRIMAGRPPVVVTMDPPLAPWNRGSEAVVAAALARDYRPALSVPRQGGRMVAFVRRRVTSARASPAARSAGAAE